jgi:hypothetical protein
MGKIKRLPRDFRMSFPEAEDETWQRGMAGSGTVSIDGYQGVGRVLLSNRAAYGVTRKAFSIGYRYTRLPFDELTKVWGPVQRSRRSVRVGFETDDHELAAILDYPGDSVLEFITSLR